MVAVILFQIPIIILISLVPEDGWLALIYHLITVDHGAKALVGVLQGMVGLYVYRLGSNAYFDSKKHDSALTHDFQQVGNLATIFSMVSAIAIFASQQPLIYQWALRPIILTSPIILVVMSLSYGFAYGRSDYLPLMFVSSLVTFFIGFIMGTMIVTITSIEGAPFPCFSAFGLNAMLFGGQVGFFVSDSECPLAAIIRKRSHMVFLNFALAIILEFFIVLIITHS